MKRLYLILALLIGFFAAAPLYGVNAGDITAAWVCGADEQSDSRINAWVLDLRIYATGTPSFAMGIDSTFPTTPPYNPTTGAKVVLSVTSVQPVIGGGTTTTTRTVYGTQWVREPYPNPTVADMIAAGSADACSGDTVPTGYADIRVALSDFVYASDSSLSLNVAAGAITVGATPNTLTTGLSVTNGSSTSINACANSTLYYPAACTAASYPAPVCRWATVPYQDVTTSSFSVEVACFHRHYRPFQPVQAVVISAADAHSHTVSYQVNYPTVSRTTPGDQGAVQVYAASIDLSTMTQGDTITANFKAYPWVGDAASVLDSSSTSGMIVTGAKNAGGTNYAANDTGSITGASCAVPANYKVLTITGSAVATFAITYPGKGCATTTAAATTAGGAQPGTPGTGFTVNTSVLRGLPGNEDIGPLVFLNCDGSSSGVCANPAAVVDPASTAASAAVYATIALAEPAYAGNANTAYQTVQAAAAACKTYNNSNNSHNDPGGCHLRLVTANHTLGTNGSDLTAQKDWLVAEPYTSATPTIVAGANGGMHVELIEYNGVTVNDSGCSSGTCYIFVGVAATDRLWLNNNSITHPSGAIYNWDAVYASNNTVVSINSSGFSDFGSTKTPWPLIRGNSFPVSINSKCSFYAVLANKNCFVRSYEQSISTSGAANSAKQALSDGVVYAFNQLYGSTQQWNSSQSYWNTAGTGGVMNYGCAAVGNIMEATTAGAAPLFGISNDGTTEPSQNCMAWENTLVGERTNLFYNDGADSGDSGHSNWYAETLNSIVGNIFAGYNSKTDTFVGTANGARTGNWAAHYHVGSSSNWFLNSNGSLGEGNNTWLGMFSGLYSNYNGTQVAGTDSASYIANAVCTASSGNHPVTGGSYANCWTAQGNTGGDSKQTWTSGNIYDPLGFVLDKSYSTGTAAGSGDYHLKSYTSAVGFIPSGGPCPLPYDFDGQIRNCSGWGSVGAYEQAIVLTPVFGW